MNVYRTPDPDDGGVFRSIEPGGQRVCDRPHLVRCCSCPRALLFDAPRKPRAAREGVHPSLVPYRRALHIVSAAAILTTLSLAVGLGLLARETRQLVSTLAVRPTAPIERVVLRGVELDGRALQGKVQLSRAGDHVVGVEVRGLEPGGVPVAAGLANGDVVTAVNGVRLSSPAVATRAYDDALRRRRVVLDVLRRGRPLRLDIAWGS